MSKGIKMLKAYKNNGIAGSVVGIERLSRDDNGSLYCEDPNCRKKVEYNSGHVREATQTLVAPHLKLAKGHSHVPDCKNSVLGSVTIFVKESNDIENVPSIFDELKDGSFTLRLNLLQESKSELDRLIQNINKTSSTNNLSGEFIQINKKIASYCKSAAGIAKLRSLILDSQGVTELESLIKIKYKNEDIPWNDFFYDDERYHILFNRINKGTINHPIAIRITAKSIRSSQSIQFPTSIQCYSENNQNSFYIPWINLDKDLSNLTINSNNSYVVLAHATSTEKNNYKNIILKVSNENQIVSEK